MKWGLAILLLVLLQLQYRLWVGEGSFAHIKQLEHSIDEQRAANRRLRNRNNMLELEINGLKNGLAGIEEKARSELGMIKEGETFYMFVEK